MSAIVGYCSFPEVVVDTAGSNFNTDRDPPFYQRTTDQQIMREHGVRIESWGPFAEGKNNLFAHPVLSAIAEEHGKSVAQVVLRWLVQREVVVIPKSVRADRMAQNLAVFDFALTDEQMTRIAAL
ncbi:aldo/keto reductase, partial [Actinophytocola sp.]|uniref:aldo/keto reductase n=1 Tax=Actinophytocola sp. TaxID=1872138 RepID=UPI002D7FEBB7